MTRSKIQQMKEDIIDQLENDELDEATRERLEARLERLDEAVYEADCGCSELGD